MIRVVLVAALVVLGAACEGRDTQRRTSGDGSDRVPAGTVGSACSSNAQPQRGAPVAIDPTACLSVGVLDGDPMEELDRVVTPFLLPDGSLAVPTTGASSIRIFSSDGTFLRSLGRPGDGPGELGYLTSAWPRGDTIEAFDFGGVRLVRFLPGDSVATVPLRAPVGSMIQGALGAGWLSSRLRGGYVTRDSMVVRAVPRSLVDSIAAGRSFETQSVEIATVLGMQREIAPRRSGPHPLTPTAVAVSHGDEVYVGETLTPRLSVYAADGTLLREIALPLEPPTGAAAALSQIVDSAVALADEADRADVRAQWSSYGVPERLSVFWAVIVDELGFVWVRPYDPIAHSLALEGLPSNQGGPGGRWLVLTSEGEEVGWIDVPDGLEPRYVSADRVVGVHRDELGVESVRVHPLRRR